MAVALPLIVGPTPESCEAMAREARRAIVREIDRGSVVHTQALLALLARVDAVRCEV